MRRAPVSALSRAGGGHGAARATVRRTRPAAPAWMASGRTAAPTRWRYGVDRDHGSAMTLEDDVNI
jgi:hypothetical protein